MSETRNSQQQTSNGPGLSARGLRLSGLKSSLAGPFDLEAAPGDIVAVSGASGSGKSLFLRMIADLDPNDGVVTLEGVDRANLTADQWRRRSPYVAAESGWWADAVEEHFPAGQRDAARRLAERLGVGEAQFGGPVARLSTGERQRLALVRAFILDAPLTLLDEPTGPLDPESVREVEALLLERAKAGKIVILASHDPQQPLRLGARHVRMVNRKLAAEAS